jgi:hypothetical protein
MANIFTNVKDNEERRLSRMSHMYNVMVQSYNAEEAKDASNSHGMKNTKTGKRDLGNVDVYMPPRKRSIIVANARTGTSTGTSPNSRPTPITNPSTSASTSYHVPSRQPPTAVSTNYHVPARQ